MSKYFKFYEPEVKSKYQTDIDTIRNYLEEVGEVHCTDKDLKELWGEFSASWAACWLNPRTGDEGNLDDFAYWLAHYDEED